MTYWYDLTCINWRIHALKCWESGPFTLLREQKQVEKMSLWAATIFCSVSHCPQNNGYFQNLPMPSPNYSPSSLPTPFWNKEFHGDIATHPYIGSEVQAICFFFFFHCCCCWTLKGNLINKKSEKNSWNSSYVSNRVINTRKGWGWFITLLS